MRLSKSVTSFFFFYPAMLLFSCTTAKPFINIFYFCNLTFTDYAFKNARKTKRSSIKRAQTL
ncbi:hypothetical protein C8N47_103255 [Mangrovibacterium marinum]|uniref:Lipoprotein n=1 Tax=Mangrovibacterium marinum TaxID=1639118 RepID=A0A2T5C507_9BACT|nr:hypothetical protein C8N47_103255 [Mangrovibacterium marinum]